MVLYAAATYTNISQTFDMRGLHGGIRLIEDGASDGGTSVGEVLRASRDPAVVAAIVNHSGGSYQPLPSFSDMGQVGKPCTCTRSYR